MSAATYSRYLTVSSLPLIGVAALFLFLSASSLAHRLDGSNYSGHDASLCAYADGNTAGAVSCSDPLANPCYSGRSTSTHNPNVAGHGHAGYPPGKATTAACIAFQRANPRNAHCDDRHCIDPNDQRVFFEHNAADHACSVCENGKCGFWGTQEARHRHEGLCPDETCAHGEACDGYGEHDPTDHDCAACDDQNGTCGYHLGHRHPGQCPNIIVDPPPPAETCECCEGIQVTKGEGEMCEQTCGSLLRQHPNACPVVDPPVVDPPVDPPPPEIDPEVDQPGCFDNPPHPYHNGCPGPNVLPGHDCASADYHSHSDAFNGECHSDEFEHGVIGCGRDMHQHGDHECHNDSIVHVTCAHGEACDSWGEHEEVEHDCTVCDDRDGTCGWLDGHRHPNQCPNDPDWEPPDDTPVDPSDDPPVDSPECPACPICLSCPYVPPCPEPRIEYVEYCPVKRPQWGTDTWQ